MTRTLKIFTPALVTLLAATAIALSVGLQIGGGAAPRELLDPGALVRYLLPAARTVVNLSLAVMLGALVFALWGLDPKKPEWGKTLDLAAAAAGVLTVSGAVTLLVTFVDVSSQAFSLDEQFGASLAQFITEFELGQVWLYLVLLAAASSVLLFAIRSRKLLLLPLVTAGLTTFPLAAQGHAAGASGHSLAVNSMFLHLTGAAVWLGGIITLVLLAGTVAKTRLPVLASRYSTLALFAALFVAASGIVSGVTRLNNPTELLSTGYGQLLLGKAALLVALIAFGAWQRLALIRKLAAQPESGKTYALILTLELAVMGLASGLAGALGRTATPVAIVPARDSGAEITPAEFLTGEKLPAPFTPTAIFTAWKFDLLWASIAVLGIVLYWVAVVKLRRRGDSWSLLRATSWTAGLLLLFYVTNGFLNVYEAYLFSFHMLGHMFLTMLIPMLLVLGAPVTLLLRAVPKRQDGSWGLREWALWLVETPYSRVLTNPIVSAMIFAGSLWVFYFTPILRWSMGTHLGHQWMIVHFLLSGYFFTLALVGIDPVPKRAPYPLRVFILLAAMVAHAFFGVTVMSGTGLLAADWFGAMGRTWGDTPLLDQQSGGGIAWGIGEIPTLIIMLVLSVQWARNDEKEQRRKDRAAERSGDAELHEYNQMLQERAARNARG